MSFLPYQAAFQSLAGIVKFPTIQLNSISIYLEKVSCSTGERLSPTSLSQLRALALNPGHPPSGLQTNQW